MNDNKILKKVSDDELYEIASDLVKIPSYTGLENQEKKVADYIYEFFKKEKIEVKSYKVLEGRPNIVAIIRGTGKGKSLMLSGHMDTVPPYKMKINPFSGEIENEKLYGRGSCDMKGALACMMSAMAAIKKSGEKLSGNLVFTAVINEEQKSEGTEYLVKNGPYTDAAIVGEPTNLNIAAGHRGLEWFEIDIIGKTTHGGTPSEGINAISKAAKLITRIETDLIPKFKDRKHPLIGGPQLNFGVIKGGDQPSSVAGRCSIYIDRRWIPSESFDLIVNEFKSIINDLKKEDSSFNAEIHRYFEDSDMMLHKPLEIDMKHPIILSLEKSIRKSTEKSPKIVSFQAWTDASLLSNFGNIPSVVFGPGYLKDAHSDVEFIDLYQLKKAYEIYTLTSIDFCNGDKSNDE